MALLNLRVGTQRSGRAKMRGVEKEQLAFGKVTWNVNGALTNVARGRGSCCIDFAVEFRPRAHGSSWPVHCPKSDKACEYVREVPRWSERCKLRRTAREKNNGDLVGCCGMSRVQVKAQHGAMQHKGRDLWNKTQREAGCALIPNVTCLIICRI